MSFNPGDLVRLKSGRHPMTVEKVDGDAVTCVWETGAAIDLRRERETYVSTVLVVWTSPSEAPKPAFLGRAGRSMDWMGR
jgi:uncharacterized protein YodC (DUF2158 family)